MIKRKTTVSIKKVTWEYILLILFLALAGVGLATALAMQSIKQNEVVHESFQRDVLSKDFSELIGFYRSVAQGLTRKHELRDILEFNDVDNAVIWAQNVRDLFPETIGVALFDLDGNVLGDPLQLRLGKQCVLDMQRLMNNEKIAQPPVHRDDPRLRHFDIAQPVIFNNEMYGLLFISFSLDVIQRRISDLIGVDQYLSIEDSSGIRIASIGELNIDRHNMPENARINIPQTDWNLVYLAPDTTANELFIMAVLISAVVLLITVLLTLFFSGYLVKVFHSDLMMIRRKLDRVSTGKDDYDEGQDRTSLVETSAIMQDVSSMVEQIEQANKRLKELSMNDPLTDLLNRRAFNDALNHHINLVSRGASVCLVLLDLDLFKAVNDKYGHATGDEVLIALADSLRERCRATDVVSRLGGDEFVLILSGKMATTIDSWFDEINTLFKEKQSQLNNGQGVDPVCSISAGMVCIEKNSHHQASELMLQVDRLLYKAKESGRGTIYY